jgi:hypothetical protein
MEGTNENMYDEIAPLVESVTCKLGFDISNELSGKRKKRKTNVKEEGKTSFLRINKILYLSKKETLQFKLHFHNSNFIFFLYYEWMA